MNIEKIIIDSFEQVGIFIDYNTKDIDLRDYILDSLQFITAIVQLEKTLNIELPDEFLQISNFSSLRSLALKINALMSI